MTPSAYLLATGYVGAGELPNGRVWGIVPLTFGRARIQVFATRPGSDPPIDLGSDDEW